MILLCLCVCVCVITVWYFDQNISESFFAERLRDIGLIDNILALLATQDYAAIVPAQIVAATDNWKKIYWMTFLLLYALNHTNFIDIVIWLRFIVGW